MRVVPAGPGDPWGQGRPIIARLSNRGRSVWVARRPTKRRVQKIIAAHRDHERAGAPEGQQAWRRACGLSRRVRVTHGGRGDRLLRALATAVARYGSFTTRPAPPARGSRGAHRYVYSPSALGACAPESRGKHEGRIGDAHAHMSAQRGGVCVRVYTVCMRARVYRLVTGSAAKGDGTVCRQRWWVWCAVMGATRRSMPAPPSQHWHHARTSL